MNQKKDLWNPLLYTAKHGYVYDYGEQLLELLAPKEGERILDLGCGSGQLTFQISELAKEVIGMDKSPEMISAAKSQFKNIEFLVGDAANFSFDRGFDSIFSNAALHWVKNYQGAIKCMYANLNPGGKLVVEFGGKGNVQTIVNQLRLSLRNRGYITQSELELWYFPSIGAYASALEAEGFKVNFAEHYDRPTVLADEQSGITDWLDMFAESFFTTIDSEEIQEIKQEVQDKIQGQCLINGKWYADYKRIRIMATK